MRLLLLLLFPLLAWGGDAEDLRALLDRQAAAWNQGDLAAFMTTYEDSPDLTYTGRRGVTRGYQAVLESYKKAYSTREAMGTLKFSDIEVRTLGPGVALVLGKFDLERTAAGGGPASGRFTLVVRKTAAGWKIIHDHSSSSQ
jgi:uncharacterized protein (TIGR02246 family)